MAKAEPPSPRMRRAGLALLALLAAAAAAFVPARSIQLLRLQNGKPLLSRYPVQEDPQDQPRLRLLRRRENLDQVVADGATQFDKIVLLRRWASRQWKSAPSAFYYPAWDAEEILHLARHGNRAFCAYATVFLQACRALGLHARYVDMGHFVVSVWSDDYDRWVLMDPTNDLHYERKGGKPMGDAWLERAALSGRTAGIEAVGSDGSRRPVTSDELEGFRRLSVCMVANQLSRPVRVIVNGKPRVLGLEADSRRYPLIGRDQLTYENFCLTPDASRAGPAWTRSDDIEDYRDPFDQTLIVAGSEDSRAGVVRLKLMAEDTPDADGFVVKAGRSAARPASGDVSWALKPGLNRLSARVKTKAGWLGPPSVIEVYFKPGWLGRLSYGVRSLL